MKIYRNNSVKIGNIISSAIFSLFIVIIFILNASNEIKENNFENIKYYLLIIIPVLYITIYLCINYIGYISIYENKMCIKKLFKKQIIPFYSILKINAPYIVTMNKIMYFSPDEKSFWNDFNKKYYEYYNRNIIYFNSIKEISERIISIITEINESYYFERPIRPSIFIVFFLWFNKIIKFIGKYSLYKNHYKYIIKLNREITKNKNKPNFV
jgi:quinol-cytochrome oxidoreductase complex cytochrome b subunit